ncbi:hypothetical protein [Leptospira levettii]|uniref:hypothetical protein n=1 Tax=Leptospira levettii TaxID=2023178 RepID=UPI000CBA073C|nr:hypothetical protein [Leptospira levettii]PJZ87481.1 hypothetical protein CH368_16595 [Leptospira levettii]
MKLRGWGMLAATKEEKKVTVLFDKELLKRVDLYASNNEMDTSKVIRLAVKKLLNESPVEIKRSAKK